MNTWLEQQLSEQLKARNVVFGIFMCDFMTAALARGIVGLNVSRKEAKQQVAEERREEKMQESVPVGRGGDDGDGDGARRESDGCGGGGLGTASVALQ